MSSNILRVLTPLRQALERIDRKARPLLATPELLDTEAWIQRKERTYLM